MPKLTEATDAQLTAAYIKLRDVLAEKKAAYDTDVAGDKDKQTQIEAEFMRRMNERGIDSVSCRGVGTAYRSRRTSATVADTGAYFQWIAEDFTGRSGFLESRANKTAVDEFVKEHEDLPPGINYKVSYAINFTRG